MMPLNIIHKAICIYYDISYTDVFNKSRKNKFIKPRQTFQYLSREFNGTKVSLEKIGTYYKEITGNFWDHATVRHSCIAVQGFIDTDREYREEIDEIKLLCNSVDLKKEMELPEEKNKLIRLILNSRNYNTLLFNLNSYLEISNFSKE